MKKVLSILFGLVIILTSFALPQSTMAASLGQVKNVKVVSITSSSVKLKWKKVKGATGYQIYYSLNKKKGYKKIVTVNNGKTVTAAVNKLKSNKRYYFKVRAVKKKKKGKYSKVVTAKTLKATVNKKADKKNNSTTTTASTTKPNVQNNVSEKPGNENTSEDSSHNIENGNGGRD